MGSIFKIIIGLISAVFIAFGGMAVTTGFVDAVAANNYMESVSNIILESYYNQEVISQCCEDAKEKGYELTVDVIAGANPGEKKYMKLKFKYDFQIKLFNFKQSKVKTKIL